MPSFTYTALDARGTEKSGRIEASDARHAGVALRQQGLFPTRVDQAGGGSASTGQGARKHFQRPRAFGLFKVVRPKELAIFTRQLGTLIHAGMPLLRSLEVLARQERNAAFRRVIEALADGIKSGVPLSEAMSAHGRVFDRLYVSMIRAGEAGGVLDGVLDQLAKFQEKSLQLRGKVTAAMVYPIIVLAVAVAILAGLLVLVVPKFKQIFADLLKGAPLPPLTNWVMTISDLVRHNLLLVGGIMVTAVVLIRLYRRSESGARTMDTLVVKMPLFGNLFLKAIVARFGRTLGTLLSTGVPILPALLITRDTSGNARVAGAITNIHDEVKAGAPVARPLEATAVFPPMVASMIEVGEQTGQLPAMLNKVADIYEDEVDNAVAGLSSLIEPILILFLALVVGTIVIALFLPIIRIVQLLT